MTTFQLDECINSRSLAEGCVAGGVAEVKRFPRDCRGIKDPEILAEFMLLSTPFVTTDSAIANEHAAFIPDAHPGIVIINNAPEIAVTLRLSDVKRILARFKTSFPQWHQISWANSIVRMTQTSFQIWHVTSGKLVHDLFTEFSEAVWVSKSLDTLNVNASRVSKRIGGLGTTGTGAEG